MGGEGASLAKRFPKTHCGYLNPKFCRKSTDFVRSCAKDKMGRKYLLRVATGQTLSTWDMPVRAFPSDIGRALQLTYTVNNLAFDTMTAVSFDSDFNTMGNQDYRYTMQAIEDSNVRLGVLLQAPELTFAKLDRKLFPKALTGSHRFVKFIRMVLSKRLSASKTVSRDIFSFLQECKDPHTGKELSTAELSTETATFIVAGKCHCRSLCHAAKTEKH